MTDKMRNYAEGQPVDNAVAYWKQVAAEQDRLVSEGKRSPFLATTYKTSAQIMNGFISISGLHDVEKSAGKLGWDMGSDASAGTIAKDAARLGFDSSMSLLALLPAGKAIGGMAKGEKLFTTAKAGTEIAGMSLKAGKTAAGGVADELAGAIAKTIPEGGEVTAQHSKALLSELKSIGQKYGIEIKEGGNVGESVGKMNQIMVNTKVGGPHEITHVVQQLQTRATALEAQAQKLGKTVGELTPAERTGAFKNFVEPFENAAYNQHEMFAKGATKFGGSAKSTYGEALKDNVKSFAEGLAEGKVPEANVGAVANAYGRLPNVVGRGQGQMLINTGSVTAASVNKSKENL